MVGEIFPLNPPPITMITAHSLVCQAPAVLLYWEVIKLIITIIRGGGQELVLQEDLLVLGGDGVPHGRVFGWQFPVVVQL